MSIPEVIEHFIETVEPQPTTLTKSLGFSVMRNLGSFKSLNAKLEDTFEQARIAELRRNPEEIYKVINAQWIYKQSIYDSSLSIAKMINSPVQRELLAVYSTALGAEISPMMLNSSLEKDFISLLTMIGECNERLFPLINSLGGDFIVRLTMIGKDSESLLPLLENPNYVARRLQKELFEKSFELVFDLVSKVDAEQNAALPSSFQFRKNLP